MSAEWVTAIATAGTLVVIATSATTAVVQLRHIGRSNQIALLTSFNSEVGSPEFLRAFQFVNQTLPERKLTLEELRALAEASFTGEFHAIRRVANVYESMGAFVAAGILEKEIICNLFGVNILNAWRSTAPIATLIREATARPQAWENFEYLAALSEQFLERHPDGTLPKGSPRMPRDSSLISRYRERGE